jgi:ribosomal protein L32E
MDSFREYDVVRVKKLEQPWRYFDGTESVMRPPQIGDVGTIVHMPPDTQGLKSMCIVECVDNEGYTVWLADFTIDELELVEAVK